MKCCCNRLFGTESATITNQIYISIAAVLQSIVNTNDSECQSTSETQSPSPPNSLRRRVLFHIAFSEQREAHDHSRFFSVVSVLVLCTGRSRWCECCRTTTNYLVGLTYSSFDDKRCLSYFMFSSGPNHPGGEEEPPWQPMVLFFLACFLALLKTKLS